MGRIGLLFFIITLVGCGPLHTKTIQEKSSSLEEVDPVRPDDPEQDPVDDTVGDEDPVDEEEDPVQEKPLEICSKLNFENVTWSPSLTFAERNALALALNISGSFEGSAGWSNLANNFDGQGMSFGLLNQTLGTGSLQPLMTRFSSENPALGQRIFGSLWSSLQSMLADWNRGLNSTEFLLMPMVVQEKEFVGAGPDRDKYYAMPQGGLFQMDTRNQRSVTWAVNTLYVNGNGSTFKSSWKNAIKAMGETPEYISLQVEAAERLHNRALNYHDRLNFDELRAYLFLFDIVVQNGGLRSSHINSYFNYLEDNPADSKTDNLLNLLEIRVLSSLPQWRDDVRRRKRTVILGTGTVHGASRNLPREYCYNSTQTF